MLKKATLLLLLLQHLCWSQDFSKNWESHFSYVDIVSSDNSENKLYVAASNSFFIYNTLNNTTTEFSTINGLASEGIKVIKYSESRELIFVGFENGLVEVIDEKTRKVMSFLDISTLQNFPADKIFINDFFEDENFLYIATGFGIIEFDLDKSVFRNTYQISNGLSEISNVISLGVIGDFIFASIEGRGTFKGNKRDQNLLLVDNWINIQSNSFNDFKIFSGQIISKDDTKIYSFNGTQFVERYTSNPIKIVDFSVSANKLSLTQSDQNNGSGINDRYIRLDTSFNIEETVEFTGIKNKISETFFLNNEVYFAEKGKGYQKTKNQKLIDGEILSPVGPSRNEIFSIDTYNGDTWLTYGELDDKFGFAGTNASKLGLSRMRNGVWLNIPFTDFEAERIVHALIDRNNINRVYFSGFVSGMLIYENNIFEKITINNSNLEKNQLFERTSVFKSAFDNNGGLWVINSLTERMLKELSISGAEVNEVSTSDILSIKPGFLAGASDFVFTENDNVILATFRGGLIGYSPQAKTTTLIPTSTLDDIDVLQLKSLIIDNEGDLWVGYNQGLRIIKNPDNIIDDPKSIIAEPIIFLEDGVPQELLADQPVTDIVVDAENNKWVATNGAGVFQFSPNGQETLNQFTTKNSPLPSDNIRDIAIDNLTGNIFFATDKGLMEFKSNVVEAQQSFDKFKIFPNPIRPEYGDVKIRIEGLTPAANVKITDIEGNLVYEAQNSSTNGIGSGLIEWDTRSFSGNKVATGVYLVLITSEDQLQTKVGKLLIVR